MRKSSDNALKAITIDLKGAAYPTAVAGEIKRLLHHTFGWSTATGIEYGLMSIRRWEPGELAKPDFPSVEPLKPVDRKLAKSLASMLAHFVPSSISVTEFIERNERASCHVGLTTVYGCAYCSQQIAAIRVLQLAREHGLLE